MVPGVIRTGLARNHIQPCIAYQLFLAGYELEGAGFRYYSDSRLHSHRGDGAYLLNPAFQFCVCVYELFYSLVVVFKFFVNLVYQAFIHTLKRSILLEGIAEGMQLVADCRANLVKVRSEACFHTEGSVDGLWGSPWHEVVGCASES